MGPRANLDVLVKRKKAPDCPARSLITIQIVLPRDSTVMTCIYLFISGLFNLLATDVFFSNFSTPCI